MTQTNTEESPSDKELGTPPQYYGADLSDHKHGEDVRAWMNDPEAGLITLIGKVGTGKTRMLYAVKRLLVLRYHCVWPRPYKHYTVPDLCSQAQDWERNHKLIAELIRFERFLLLDDLGIEKTTEFLQQELERLICGRDEWDRPTLITTNLTLHDPPQLSQRYGERIASRIARGQVLEFSGEDHRIDRSKP